MLNTVILLVTLWFIDVEAELVSRHVSLVKKSFGILAGVRDGLNFMRVPEIFRGVSQCKWVSGISFSEYKSIARGQIDKLLLQH